MLIEVMLASGVAEVSATNPVISEQRSVARRGREHTESFSTALIDSKRPVLVEAYVLNARMSAELSPLRIFRLA